MHRFLRHPPPGMVVDHINGNRLDNRAGNTRICTQQQNTFNSRPKGKSSKFKGVCWDKSKRKWLVPICIDGKNSWTGRFDDEVEAARAYDRKAAEIFREYAFLNLPQENQAFYGDPPPDADDGSGEGATRGPGVRRQQAPEGPSRGTETARCAATFRAYDRLPVRDAGSENVAARRARSVPEEARR
jgi:hypothetical protein